MIFLSFKIPILKRKKILFFQCQRTLCKEFLCCSWVFKFASYISVHKSINLKFNVLVTYFIWTERLMVVKFKLNCPQPCLSKEWTWKIIQFLQCREVSWHDWNKSEIVYKYTIRWGKYVPPWTWNWIKTTTIEYLLTLFIVSFFIHWTYSFVFNPLLYCFAFWYFNVKNVFYLTYSIFKLFA